jgi:FixJ family two-component response regulator
MIPDASVVEAMHSDMQAGTRAAAQRPTQSRAPAGAISAEAERPHILVVDDDVSIREALQLLFLSVGLDATCFESARELLEADIPQRPGCLILDVRLRGSSGLDLQRRLAARDDVPPIIFLTGHGDIPMSVNAMKAGAVDFLTKPVRDQTLLDAVAVAIERDIARRSEALRVRQHAERLALLTAREREVFREVARGRLNKQIAFDLGISEVTVKLHRGNLMRKMETASVGELIRAWEALPADMREARAA